jgi:hypothetical protein
MNAPNMHIKQLKKSQSKKPATCRFESEKGLR